MTYNIRMGTYNPLGLEGIARVIKAHQPDIIGLQEINVYGYPTGPINQPEWLAQRLGLQFAFGPARQFPEYVLPNIGGWSGNAILSRFPIRDTAVQKLPKLAATPYQAAVLGVTIDAPNSPLNIFATHWPVDISLHSSQAAATVQFTQTWNQGLPVVLLGDFNAVPSSPAIATVRAVYQDAWGKITFPLHEQTTYPSGPPGTRTPDGWSDIVDYLFASPDIAVSGVKIIYDTTQASDHNPVMADIRL